MKTLALALVLALSAGALALVSCGGGADAGDSAAVAANRTFDDQIADHAATMMTEGRATFRLDTFGSEAFWGDSLGLHRSILGEAQGGVGDGLTPVEALGLGLKVDLDALPGNLVAKIRNGTADLESPATTNELIRHDAVIGLRGFYDGTTLQRVGITCALCHSQVDDTLVAGIGHRLDGWPNRDLDVGRIVLLAPNLQPLLDLLGVTAEEATAILTAWGPGRYDAELNLDGQGFRPDGETAATLIPAAFGKAGVNEHTWTTGWGSTTYWNAFVANTQMMGKGTFVDARLNDAAKYPIATNAGFFDIRNEDDRITGKLAALHFYQLAIPAPRPPAGSFDAAAAARGKIVFTETANCATCHVPPIYTEPGWNTHTGAEVGIDEFQALRSPGGRYRTQPLSGLFARLKGGLYHDGRFATLADLVNHYDAHFASFELTAEQKSDLVEFLKSL